MKHLVWTVAGCFTLACGVGFDAGDDGGAAGGRGGSSVDGAAAGGNDPVAAVGGSAAGSGPGGGGSGGAPTAATGGGAGSLPDGGGGQGGTCEPTFSASDCMEGQCGLYDDGCGDQVDCGSCGFGFCGGLGPNLCGTCQSCGDGMEDGMPDACPELLCPPDKPACCPITNGCSKSTVYCQKVYEDPNGLEYYCCGKHP